MIQQFKIKNCFKYGGKTTERVCQEAIDEMGELGYEPIQITTTETTMSDQRVVILFKLSVVTGEMKDEAVKT